MTNHRTPIGAGLALVAAALLLIPTAPALGTVLTQPDGIQDDGVSLVVPQGSTLYVDGPVVRQSIVVAGAIVQSAPGALTLTAGRIDLLSGSLVAGFDGAKASDVSGTTVQAPAGLAGGDVVLTAGTLVAEPGSTVRAGSGGAGGLALGTVQALGGAGGDGGSVVLSANAWDLQGALLPGAGGDGGFAVQAGPATDALSTGAVGGDGGVSGRSLLNGLPVSGLLAEAAAPSSTQANALSTDAICALLASLLSDSRSTRDLNLNGITFDGGCVPDLPNLAALLSSVTAVIDQCGLGSVTFGQASAQSSASAYSLDCAALVAEALALPGAGLAIVAGVLDDCGISVQAYGASSSPTSSSAASIASCQAILAEASALVALALATVGAELADCGVNAFTAASSGPAAPMAANVNVLGFSCAEAIAALESDVLHLVLVPGLVGVPGGTGVGCTTAHGSDGAPNYMGDGGDGGDGCTSASGGNGDHGANGNSGWFGCSNGGWGGNGGSGGALAASGGKGGEGLRDGGNGGSATSSGTGGNGGSGGNGGKASIGTDCAGGNGGAGGEGKGGDVTPGPGGNGICGTGGSGGHATSTGYGGSGGAGGAGNPSGVPGAPGAGVSGTGNGATGLGGAGPGLPVC